MRAACRSATCSTTAPRVRSGDRQSICNCRPKTFCAELASARTFILKHEAEWLREQGLGERVTCSDLLVFDDTGPVGNRLRFPDECVRHKTLDLVGDLALAGCDIEGRIVAYRSGHRLNAELVQRLLHPHAVAQQRHRVA